MRQLESREELKESPWSGRQEEGSCGMAWSESPKKGQVKTIEGSKKDFGV